MKKKIKNKIIKDKLIPRGSVDGLSSPNFAYSTALVDIMTAMSRSGIRFCVVNENKTKIIDVKAAEASFGTGSVSESGTTTVTSVVCFKADI